MASSTVTLEKTTTISSRGVDVPSSPTTMRTRLLKKKGKGGEKGRCCGHKYELIGYEALPEFLKHNEFVLDYYRSEWPIKQALLSVFSVHNETINVWTHLIGFFVFLALTVCAATMVPMEYEASSSPHMTITTMTNNTGMTKVNQLMMVLIDDGRGAVMATHSYYSLRNASMEAAVTVTSSPPVPHHHRRVARWPFYATPATCCSGWTTRGITGLIVTSFYPLVYYTFLCDPFHRSLYLGFITASGAAAVAVSLLPVFEVPRLRWARAGLFACMGLSGLVPILHKMLVFGARPEAVITTGYEMAMGACYLAGVVVYATRVPERWMPGRFDLAGHSHQLFHVLVIAGAYAHYLAGLVYLSWRDMEGCSS
ncbi:hypothetical protein PR202_gb18928 [Eleusine coracana subsp. coracana]|uniref:Uncharacterized protein n=1 Tax=Eleusine coracana subsp. coracana TaxID=191504 RepID=A0AAV5F4P5_ELECO|nr:hypothetical protein PR202_gb18928 [Eleusine coracana subsp. coracana]